MHFVVRWLAGIAVFVLLLGCTEARSNSLSSPNGDLTLVTSVNQNRDDSTKYLCVKFQILDTTGKVLYEEQTGASDRMRWSMYWENNDRIVLDSSDIGVLVWEQQVNDEWQKVP